MGKKATEVKGEMPLANPEGKTVEELKEVAHTLQTQVRHHHQMMTKAQGGLEVILQMIPREEVEKLIAAENRDNNDTKTVN